MYLAIMCHYHNEQYLHIISIEGWAYQTIILIGYNESNQYVIFITNPLCCMNIHTNDIIHKNQMMPYF